MSGLVATTERMARREAAAAFLVSDAMLRAFWASFDEKSFGANEPVLDVHVVTCPECGAGEREAAAYLWTLPFWFEQGDLRVVSFGTPGAGGLGLVVVGCEMIPARSFLLIAVARRKFGSGPVRLHSRAAALALEPGHAADLAGRIAFLDVCEAWSDGLLAGNAEPDGSAQAEDEIWVLPSSTRRNVEVGGHAGPVSPASRLPFADLSPQFASPHGTGDARDEELNRLYSDVRLSAAAEILRAEAKV
jgi:hypothetical protein